MTAKMYYSRAVCAGYLGQFQTAYELSEKALHLAMQEEKNHADILYALSGIVICKIAFGKLEEALIDLEKIDLILAKEKVLEIRINSLFNKAKILSQLNRTHEGLACLEKANIYIRDQKSLLNHVISISTTGELLLQQGNATSARMHFNFASSLCDPTELPYRHKLILDELNKLKPVLPHKNDLEIDFENQSVHEKSLGEINFKNQFILFDLLKLLSLKHGQPLTKEEITQSIWNETYCPEKHDNKIYVTIKRLDQLSLPIKARVFSGRSKTKRNGSFMKKILIPK